MGITGAFTGTGIAPQVSNAFGRNNSLVRVVFSEAMTNDAELQDPANYTVLPTGAGSVPSVVSVAPQSGGSPTYVDLSLSLAMTDAAEYEVTVDTAVTDLAGNPLDGAHDSYIFDAPTAGAISLDTLGLIEALTGIFGEEIAEVGGWRMTRLTAAVTEGDTIFYVESTLDWPEAGTITVDGVRYTYTSKSLTTLSGIEHIAAGVAVTGAATDHRDDSTVVDLSREFSGLDLLRRAFLVNYAEGGDLNALGRNLGVNRPPIFTDDDQFRAVIKAVAYNPKGTVYGLELALEALLGASNYEVYEDLVQFPNTVFIRIDTSVFLEDTAAGRAFLNSIDWDGLGGGQDEVVLGEEPLAVHGVRLKDLDELFNFETEKPSATTYEYWPGETPGNAFTYIGSESEATQVTVITGTGIQMISAAGGTVAYEMLDTQGARITPDSYVEISALLMVPPAAFPLGADKNQASISIKDGAYEVNVGVDITGVGLFASTGGGFLGPTYATSLNVWYEITIKKFGQDYVELWIDGALVTRQTYSLFTVVTADHQVEWGIRGVPLAGMEVWVRQIGFEIRTLTDFWNAYGAAGAVNTANPTRFDDTGALLAVGDVGKQLRIYGGVVSNGINNGTWLIASYVSPGVVELQGPIRTDAAVVSTGPDTVMVEDGEAFTYPDDIGKIIVITGSTLGNDGSYTITALIEPGTLVDYSTYATPITGAKTNIAQVSGAPPFTPEPNLEYRLDPAFQTEAGLAWELSDAGSFAGDTLTLRQGLWTNDLVMEVHYSNVYSAQLLTDESVENTVDPGPPAVYEYWPFYLADPLGLVAAYMDDLTAAGVIPEFEAL